jgi:hypothetical protein
MRRLKDTIQEILKDVADSRAGWVLVAFCSLLGVMGGINGIRHPQLYDRWGQIFLEGVPAQGVYGLLVLIFFPLMLYAVWKGISFRAKG